MTIPHPVPSLAWTLSAVVSTASAEVQIALNVLMQTVICPHGLPALQQVVAGAVRCLVSAQQFIPSPKAELTTLIEGMQKLEQLLTTELSATARTSAITELRGTRTRHPEWNLMADTGRSRAHLLSDTFLGLQLLGAFSQSKRLKPAHAKRINSLRKEEDISTKEFEIFIRGGMPDQFLGQLWALDLIRSWRTVVSVYSEEPVPPKPTARERLASQMLSAAIHGSTQMRAGALTHRQLSPRQFKKAAAAIWRAIQEDTLAGALGAISVVSTFSVDVIAALPILGSGLESDWDAAVDIGGGALQIDYQSIAPEASRPLSGCVPSSFLSIRSFPLELAKNLRARLLQYPEAKTLRELFPLDPEQVPDGPIYRSPAGMQPTWARLRNSTSRMLRQLGLDSFVVAAVTGDFTIVPRSKWYYSSLAAAEIERGFKYLYTHLGWGGPVQSKNQLNFGCQVVPTEATIKGLDARLIQELQESAPGRHTSPILLMKFHNCYMHVLGARLSLLLALRETKEFNIQASFDEMADEWVPIHDKDVPNDLGYMPVPICKFLSETIHAHRRHCNVMHSRLQTLNLGESDLARWCLLVVRRSQVPLLCIAENTDTIRALATRDFMYVDAGVAALPPDFGRKVMENLLRSEGMRSSDIDSILRHTLKGQGHTSATSDYSPQCLHQRFEFAMEHITTRLFGSVTFGLSKE
jgi:hypothetical protein